MTDSLPQVPVSDRKITGRGLANVKFWMVLALAFAILNRLNSDPQSPVSPFWFLDYVLFGLMALGIVLRERSGVRPLRVPRPWAGPAYMFLVWLFGMTYELTLTVNGEGIGGMHQHTHASFLLAQGDYLPIAVASWLLIRFGRLTFREAWFYAMGLALTEGLIFSGFLLATLLSPLFLVAPLLLAYYSFAYASFVAMPLLFLDTQTLWRDGPKRDRKLLPLIGWGFGLGCIIRLFWGLVSGPLIESWFDLPPNVI